MLKEKIKIFGRAYDIEQVGREDLDKVLKSFGHDAGDCLGLTSFSVKGIWLLNEGMSKISKIDTFWHEITHALLKETGMTYYLDDREIESFCDVFARALEDTELLKLKEFERNIK